jgi:DNA-directed RNA polymerase specialized sigma24 family protein
VSTMDRAGGSPAAAESTASEATIVGRIAAGDPTALGELYDRVAARIYFLARDVCGDAAVAEDITHDVFLDLWRLAGRFDPESTGAVAWLLTAAHRRALEVAAPGAPAPPRHGT